MSRATPDAVGIPAVVERGEGAVPVPPHIGTVIVSAMSPREVIGLRPAEPPDSVEADRRAG